MGEREREILGLNVYSFCPFSSLATAAAAAAATATTVWFVCRKKREMEKDDSLNDQLAS